MASNSAMDRRFEISSQRLKQKEAQQLQQEQEGLKRRFASQGALGSGASIKSESVAREASNRRLSEGQQQIEFAKLGEQARQEDITSQRAYQTGERVGSQEFAGEQAAIGRKFATSERIDTQKSVAELTREGWDKTAIENALNRKLTAEEGQLARDAVATEGTANRLVTTQEGAANRELSREQAANAATLAKELQGMKDIMTQKGIDIQLDELEISKYVSLFNMGGAEGDRARKELAKLLGVYAYDPTKPIVPSTLTSAGGSNPNVPSGIWATHPLNANANSPSVLEGTYFG